MLQRRKSNQLVLVQNNQGFGIRYQLLFEYERLVMKNGLCHVSYSVSGVTPLPRFRLGPFFKYHNPGDDFEHICMILN